MNTKIIIGVLAVVVVGAGAYMVIAKPASDSAMSGSEASTEQGSGRFSGSFADLTARGGEWKCTIDSSVDTGAGAAISSGVVHVSGNKVRGDFTTNVEGYGSVQAHMISDGEYVYSWSDMAPQGIKVKAAAQSSGTGPTSGQVVDLNHSYSYDCEQSSTEASLFVPPANVSFTTF